MSPFCNLCSGGSTRDYHARMRDVFRSAFYALMVNSSPSLCAEAHAGNADAEHIHQLPSVPRAMLVVVSELRCRFLRDGFAYCVARWPQLVEDSQRSILAATRRPDQTDVAAVQQLYMVQVRYFFLDYAVVTGTLDQFFVYLMYLTGELPSKPATLCV